MASRGGSADIRGRIAGAALALVAAALVLLASMRYGGLSELRAARAGLDAAGFPLAELQARHPARTAPNDSARKLEQLAGEAGLRLAPRARAGAADGKNPAREALRKWVRQQVGRPEETLEPLPKDVADELARVAPAIDAVAAAMPGLADAEWESAISPDTPIPNMLGALDLNRALIAEAWLAQDTDPARAQRLLEAAWAQTALLNRRPDLISNLIAVSAASQVACAARKMRALPPGWADRLDAAPFRAGLADGIACDAHALLDVSSRPVVPEGDDDVPKLVQLIRSPSRRAAAAAQARRCAVLAPLAKDASRCGPESIPPRPPQTQVAGFFNRDASDLGADLGATLSRLDRMALHVDLTRRVLAMKAARDADPAHAWPSAIPGGDSTACAGVRFTLTEPAPGVVRIEASSWGGAWWLDSSGNGPAMAWESSTSP